MEHNHFLLLDPVVNVFKEGGWFFTSLPKWNI